MPLKSNIDNAAFQVYFCTRAKRDSSVTSEVRPETCILRSLAMFFYVRSTHVEDLKYLNGSSIKNTHVYVYHITEHNLRSQIFKKQLLVHLESNSVLVFLREAELDFPAVYAFFPSGCTVELKKKLKHFHEKAVVVTENCYENAAIELIREIKKIQEKLLGNKLSSGQTFPIVFDNTVTSLTFGMPINGVHVESVRKVSGLSKIAIKLKKEGVDKSSERNDVRRQDMSQLRGYPGTQDSPLAVTSIELRLRKTVFEPRNRRNEMLYRKTFGKRSCDPRRRGGDDSLPLQHSGNSETSVRNTDRFSKLPQKLSVSSSSDCYGSYTQPRTSNISNLCDGPLPSQPDEIVSDDLKLNPNSSESPETEVACTPDEPCYSAVSSVGNQFDLHRAQRDIRCESIHEELRIQDCKTYAVYVPDRWGKNGEQMIYIRFPDESDQLPYQAYDLPCSGFSTPSTFNLSEEYKSPVDSPLVSIPQQRRIYPEPCPLYPLESSFPPVDLPVEFST